MLEAGMAGVPEEKTPDYQGRSGCISRDHQEELTDTGADPMAVLECTKAQTNACLNLHMARQTQR